MPAGGDRTLWLTPRPRDVEPGSVAVVVDATWSPPAADAAGPSRSVRQAAGRVLARLDPIEETSRLLDGWAAASGVVEALTIGSTSFWYRARLHHWLWLQEHLLWAAILRDLIDEIQPSALGCAPGTERSLRTVARLVAAAEGLPLRVEGPPADEPPRRPLVIPGRAPAGRPRLARLARLARRVLRAVASWTSTRRGRRTPGRPDRAALADRLDRLAAEPEPRLLVVLMQVPQHIETPDGPRVMHPSLGPIVDRLAGTALDPIIVDRFAKQRPAGRDERVLPLDAVQPDGPPHAEDLEAAALARVRAIAGVRVPAAVAGIDLGPELARHVSEDAATWIRDAHVAVARFRTLLERLPVRAVLVADEYHRQDCLEAGAMAGIPVAAVQHGTIYRRHNGYVHADRPPQLRLPDRTYVFGRWERDLLVDGSVYTADEVVVGGSPRLDVYRRTPADRATVRSEVGVPAGHRLVVLSGTYGPIYRRLIYPLLLARLFDRPLPGVTLVVKQHPAEKDEGPYRAVIEGVAAAGGFEPPPVHLVQHVDLYRLLAAADAHLGIHSTLLTEAVFVGTPNLLATGVRGGDLLDYAAAGVALPVADGGDLLSALEAAAAGAITAEAQAAFIARHFEPGVASDRIASDLLSWLA